MVVRWDDVRGTWVRYPHTSTIEHTFYKTVESKSMTFFFFYKMSNFKTGRNSMHKVPNHQTLVPSPPSAFKVQ